MKFLLIMIEPILWMFPENGKPRMLKKANTEYNEY